MVDKLLLAIDRTDDAVAAFRADPVAFVGRWEAAWEDPEPPYPEGGRLGPSERRAFVERDWAALYAMGAHPYLLWHVVRSVHVADGEDVRDVSARYVEGIRSLGHPEFAT
jgi:hypothetical protein